MPVFHYPRKVIPEPDWIGRADLERLKRPATQELELVGRTPFDEWPELRLSGNIQLISGIRQWWALGTVANRNDDILTANPDWHLESAAAWVQYQNRINGGAPSWSKGTVPITSSLVSTPGMVLIAGAGQTAHGQYSLFGTTPNFSQFYPFGHKAGYIRSSCCALLVMLGAGASMRSLYGVYSIRATIRNLRPQNDDRTYSTVFHASITQPGVTYRTAQFDVQPPVVLSWGFAPKFLGSVIDSRAILADLLAGNDRHLQNVLLTGNGETTVITVDEPTIYSSPTPGTDIWYFALRPDPMTMSANAIPDPDIVPPPSPFSTANVWNGISLQSHSICFQSIELLDAGGNLIHTAHVT